MQSNNEKKCSNCGELHPKSECWYHDGRSPDNCFDCRKTYVCQPQNEAKVRQRILWDDYKIILPPNCSELEKKQERNLKFLRDAISRIQATQNKKGIYELIIYLKTL